LKNSLVAIVLGTAAVLIAACGGGDDELTTALEDVSKGDLATMALPQSDFGSITSGFEVDTDSGLQDNSNAADDSMDPDDDSRDFVDAGRISGYELSFENSDIAGVISTGEGVISVGSEIEIFESNDQASADIARKLAEFVEYEGEELDGLVIGPHTQFDVADLGDESGGIEFSRTIPSANLTVFGTIVYVRMGRLEAAIIIGAIDDQNLREEAEAAAVKLEERMRGVLLGEIDEEPVEIPVDPTQQTSRPVDTPDGVPDLSAVALQLSDLPTGFEIEEEGYEPLPDEEFTREFGTGDALSIEIGQTEVVGIQNTINVFDSPAEAELFQTSIMQLLQGEQGKEFFASSFSQGAGFEVEVGDFQQRPLNNIGADGVAVFALIKTGLGDCAITFMVVRDGPAVSSIVVTAQAGAFNLGDIEPLAAIEAERLRAGPPN
jgi:hypothetical protein